MNEKKLKARDFITIGIFTAILWVVQMVIMYLGFLSPFIVAGYAVLIPIVTGIPMMLYLSLIHISPMPVEQTMTFTPSKKPS